MEIKERWNNFPFHPGKIPFFYGWVILIASTVGVLASAPGQTMGVSTFTDYLIEHIHISRNQISSAYMIGTIGSSFLLTWAGKQYDKFGARWVTISAALLLAFVLLLLSQSDHLVRLFVKDRESGVYAGVAVAVMVFLFFASLFGAGCVNHGFAQYAYEMVYCKAWFCKRNCVGVNYPRFFHCTAYLRLAHSGNILAICVDYYGIWHWDSIYADCLSVFSR